MNLANALVKKMRKPIIRSGIYLAVGYAGLMLMLVTLENKLVYVPRTAAQDWVAPPSADIQDIELNCADGTRIHAWYLPHPTSDQALLYCHGNAGNLSHRGNSIVKMRDVLDVSVLIIDYPGYGKSEGIPSEQGCYQAADAAYEWLCEKKNIEPKKILLYGGSLGGGVAVDLASRKEHRGIVLVNTYTTLPDTACSIYWWAPVPIRALMTNRFDNISKINKCRRPVMIVHGTDDELIPYSQGERLFAAANEPKQFVSIPGNTHNDPLPADFFTTLKEFLKKHPAD